MSFSLPPAPADSNAGVFTFIEDLADRVGTTPKALALAAATTVAMVAGGWVWWWNSSPPSAEITIPYAVPEITTTADTTLVAESTVLVHVAGAVAHPGVYSLEATARVGDAIAAAGGPTLDADVNRMNLAAPVVDGSRIYIPTVGEEIAPTLLVPDTPSATSNGLVNINTADQTTLETLPGVGPSTAAAIIDHRERHGLFRNVDDLIDVRGIGEAKLAALRNQVTT